MRYKFLILIAIFFSVSLNAQKGGKKKKEKKKDERETLAEIGDSLLDIIDDRYYYVSLNFYQLPPLYKLKIEDYLIKYTIVYIDDIIKYISELGELENIDLNNRIEILEYIYKKIKVYNINFVEDDTKLNFPTQITYKLVDINKFVKDNLKLTDLEYSTYNEVNDVNITRNLAKYTRFIYKFPLEID